MLTAFPSRPAAALLMDEGGYARFTTVIENVGKSAEEAFAKAIEAIDPKSARKAEPKPLKPIPPSRPSSLPSIAAAFSAEKNSFSFRAVVPASTLRAVVEQSKNAGLIP